MRLPLGLRGWRRLIKEGFLEGGGLHSVLEKGKGYALVEKMRPGMGTEFLYIEKREGELPGWVTMTPVNQASVLG